MASQTARGIEYTIDELRAERPGSSYPHPIVTNLRRGDDKKYHTRHLVHPTQNTTVCGLSLVRGHAWAPSDQDKVTCDKCCRIVERWARKKEREQCQ